MKSLLLIVALRLPCLVLLDVPAGQAAVPSDTVCDPSQQGPGRPRMCPCHLVPLSLDEVPLVDCTRRHLETIPEDLPPDIEEIWLNINDITAIGDQLRELHNLKFLNLELNKISVISPGAFASLQNLTQLHLDNNSLTATSLEQEAIFNGLVSLTKLSLSGNKITFLGPSVFHALPSLQWLYLDGNGLRWIDEAAFSGLRNLEVLDLRHNQLPSLPASLFLDSTQLAMLHLAHNPLESLHHGVLSHLSELSTLDLQNCRLAQLSPETFHGLRNLNYLQLGNNKFHAVPNLSVTNLQTLEIDHNPIETVPADAFRGMPNLEEISLSQMPALTVVQNRAFSGLFYLRSVALQHNPVLETVEADAFANCGNITSVFLDNNNLGTIEEMLLDWAELTDFSLHGNPLKCDCNLKWLHYLLEEINYEPHRDVTCDTPKEVKGHRVQDVEPEHFICSTNTTQSEPKVTKTKSKTQSEKIVHDVRSFLTFVGIVLGLALLSMIFNTIHKYRKSKSKNPPPDGTKVATTFTLSRKKSFRFQRMEMHGSEEMVDPSANPCNV